MPDSVDSTSSSLDLVGSTGINDTSNPLNQLLVGALNSGINAGVNYGTAQLNQALGVQTPITASTGAPGTSGSPAAAAAVTSRSWTPWIIGGVIVVILAYVFLGRGR